MEFKQGFRHGAAKFLIAALLLSAVAATLSACNTTAGVGQDISSTGHALSNTADSAKQGL
jgi:predicted small secreted protein